MNNQEVIANLNMIRVGFVDPATKEQMKLIYDTFDNAIKALEQEPCDDAIRRQAVLETLDDMDNALDEDRTVENYKELLKECYKVLPSVNPQPKTGHWISHREHCENLGVMPSGLGAYEWCSNCDCGIDVSEWYRNHYNFCPNCGAMMQESEG